MKYSLQNSTITVSYAQIDILDASKVIRDDLCKLVAIFSASSKINFIIYFKSFVSIFPNLYFAYIFFLIVESSVPISLRMSCNLMADQERQIRVRCI